MYKEKSEEKNIPKKLKKLIEEDLKDLSDEELELLVAMGKLSADLLGYPIATLSSGSTANYSCELVKDTGKMLLMGDFSGLGIEFIESSASIGGMGLAGLMGFDKFSKNLGSTGLAAMAIGGMFGMSLLPPPGIFGSYIACGIATGHFACPSYIEAEPLPCGDNLKAKNYFLSEGPLGISPGDNLSALLRGYGRDLQKGERPSCPGALPGFFGKYGFY